MEDLEATTAVASISPSARELVVCWGGNAAVFPLTTRSFIIGRSETCDVSVPLASISRRHGRLDVEEGTISFEDLGSANGARIDGAPIQGRVTVEVGSVIEIGSARLVVRTKGGNEDAAMLEVRKLIEKVAPTDVSVIILGETGVGKEVVTESLHAQSNRRGPLVRINCAGLAASLLESELFGYERGAFTGAVNAKAGLIESAHGGTLFLDELGEMPEATQVKLLRVLESREVRRIGALKAMPIDVRFISATHKDPRTLAVMGKFRDDLLYRLNGMTLRVPPLRLRREEIGGLAREFLAEACARGGRAAPEISPGAEALLESYRWPGNVRELKNVMSRVAILCETDQVHVEHVDLEPSHSQAPQAPVSQASPLSVTQPTMPPIGGDTPERDRILAELAKVGGNQAAAAKALGVTPRVLAYRMDKLGLPRPRRGQ